MFPVEVALKKGGDMKKLALFLGLLVFAVISYGQNTALDASSRKNSTSTFFDMTQGLTYKYFYGAVSDTVSSVDSSFSYTYTVVGLDEQLEAECRVKLDSVSGTPTLNVALKGKFSWNDSWTSISNADWAGTSSDTTIILQSTTAVPYRFYQVYVDAVADSTQKAKINLIELGVFK